MNAFQEADMVDLKLLAMQPRRFDVTALERWAVSMDGGATRAAGVLAAWAGAEVTDEDVTVKLRRFFRSGNGCHPFDLAGASMAWLHEPQVTTRLAHYLDRGGPAVQRAFLTALMPHHDWPANYSSFTVSCEVPTKRGRIDLLVFGTAGGTRHGVVIEAKFAHHEKNNPFSDYVRFAKTSVFQPGDDDNYLILGINEPKLPKIRGWHANVKWTFVHWRDFMRRFDEELRNAPCIGGFLDFRRIIWEMI